MERNLEELDRDSIKDRFTLTSLHSLILSQ